MNWDSFLIILKKKTLTTLKLKIRILDQFVGCLQKNVPILKNYSVGITPCRRCHCLPLRRFTRFCFDKRLRVASFLSVRIVMTTPQQKTLSNMLKLDQLRRLFNARFMQSFVFALIPSGRTLCVSAANSLRKGICLKRKAQDSHITVKKILKLFSHRSFTDHKK